jgi:predicted outer membrane repeat protein
VSGNSARYGGGGIFSEGVMTVSGCTVSDNSASEEGGGIDKPDQGGLGTGGTISGCTVSGNSARVGGGIFNSGSLTISGSTVSCNAAGYGGGIYESSDFILSGSSLMVSGCTISSNVATVTGGGICIVSLSPSFLSSATVLDSVFSANSASDGAAICVSAFSALNVRNSSFSANTASDSGAGIYNLGTATVLDSTLTGNSASSAGGGIFNGASGTVTVKDSTVLNNLTPSGADIYNLGALTLDDSTVGIIGP